MSNKSDNPASKPLTAPGKPEDIAAPLPAQLDRPDHDDKDTPDDRAARDEEARQTKARQDERDKDRAREEERLKGSARAKAEDKAAARDAVFDAAYEQGATARRSAIARDDAPHDPSTAAYTEWARGWDAVDSGAAV